ncbi:MAG TPA: orotate phosphoribosyltransferase [Candidatus Baltobacteraceae bacterium]|nr:orotate phosphoribosyltransferase [Candidatus Baltobacteraceae bacterium]
MLEVDLERALRERGALMRGHFRLSSGRHSDVFIQKFRILENPPLVEAVAKEIAAAFRATKPTVVVSAAVGGIVLGYETARQLGTDAIFVEKEDGAATLRRSFSLKPEDRALVVEDVVTTGLSVREVIDVVRRSGASVAGVGVIVQRGAADFGVPTRALLNMPLESHDPADCPQCKNGQPIDDPGSRRT